MTARITNLADYRTKKGNTTDDTVIRALTDAQIIANMEVSQKIDAGVIKLDELPDTLVNQLYPNGYDPKNHPEDNYAALAKEAERRGVMVQ